MHKHTNIHTQLEYSMLKILVGIQWKIANEMRIDTSTLEKYENIFWVIKHSLTIEKNRNHIKYPSWPQLN